MQKVIQVILLWVWSLGLGYAGTLTVVSKYAQRAGMVANINGSTIEKSRVFSEDPQVKAGFSAQALPLGCEADILGNPYVRIETHLWVDNNRDGVQQITEKDRAGIKELLLTSTGEVATCIDDNITHPCETLSDSDGMAHFRVIKGKYTLEYHLSPKERKDGYSFVNDTNKDGSIMRSAIEIFSRCFTVIQRDASIDCGYQKATIKANKGEAFGWGSMLLMFILVLLSFIYTHKDEPRS